MRKLYSYTEQAIRIMDGYKAHELVPNQQDQIINSIKEHYFVGHGSNQM